MNNLNRYILTNEDVVTFNGLANTIKNLSKQKRGSLRLNKKIAGISAFFPVFFTSDFGTEQIPEKENDLND